MEDIQKLVAARHRELTAAERREQRVARLLMLRRWWASGFELGAIRRLALVRFQVSHKHLERLMVALVDDLDTEAEAWEATAHHLVRHRHRVRFEDLMRAARANGSFAVAERCLRALAEIDGVFRQRAEDDEKPIVSIHLQGARTMTDAELAEGLRRGGERVISVPVQRIAVDE